jgi:hypothetical protein
VVGPDVQLAQLRYLRKACASPAHEVSEVVRAPRRAESRLTIELV